MRVKQDQSDSVASWPDAHPDIFIPRRLLRRNQFLHLLAFVPMMAIMSIIVAFMVTFVLHSHVFMPLLILWILMVVLPSLYSLQKALSIQKKLDLKMMKGRSLRSSLVFTLYMGAMWGCVDFLFVAPENSFGHTFMALVTMGLTTGVVASLTPLPVHCIGFSMLALPPSIIRLLAQPSMESKAIGLLLIAFVLALGYVAFRNHRTFLDSLRTKQALKMAHTQLSDAIENTGEAFAIYSADGELQLANGQFRNFFPHGRMPESESVNAFIEQLSDGRWVQTMVRKTSRGGLVSTHADITALKQQEMELISARRQAEGANHAKSQFLAVMSHELRTPLNSIIGFAELISRTDMHIQTETMREYGALILESGRHLLGLISGILDLSRIEAGRYELHEESIDLEFLAQSAVSQCRPMAEEAKVTIEIDAPSDLPHLWAEMRAMRQILFNLLSNAIKFTPEDGKVTVTFQYLDGHIVTCVRDTGIGIDEKDQELVFQAFQQVDNTLSREHPGSGLGLPLVKHLAELHGAVVTLDSQLGKGSCFTVTFPKDRVMALTEDNLS